MNKIIRIALAGNPNSGKTTLFNALTGSNQFVGNWPGVTVEKKEGTLIGHDNVIITDLPGVYSLSPYSPEERTARSYLLGDEPDVILNVVDGSNPERNLYLTTQLMEIGLPVVLAVNRMDVVQARGDRLDTAGLSKELGCPAVEISALRKEGIGEAVQAAIREAAKGRRAYSPIFTPSIEHTLNSITEILPKKIPRERRRWYAVKVFEGDQDILSELSLPSDCLRRIREAVHTEETKYGDDAEAILIDARYRFVGSVLKNRYSRKKDERPGMSDRIDRILTHRVLALPVFALIMFLLYYTSISLIGSPCADWANDCLFGEGFHLFSVGSRDYESAMDRYAADELFTPEVIANLESAVSADVTGASRILDTVKSGSYTDFREAYDEYGAALREAGYDLDSFVRSALNSPDCPDKTRFGWWVPGIPVLLERELDRAEYSPLLRGLILDGILPGVGSVLSFLPQMLVLFFLLAFLESCGYMSRIAFMMDHVLHRFGLSGKSFIPILLGTGCGVPGIMASRTIENERDRRMTIITTTFMPCGAKLPLIAMISSVLFSGAWWVAPVSYFMGIAAIALSGVMLKKLPMFSGKDTPFVMELPDYQLPALSSLLRSAWEKGLSFLKKAGTVIFLSSVLVWVGSHIGIAESVFILSTDLEPEQSLLGWIAALICRIFAPLGFGGIRETIAVLMGLLAKEEVVAVFGVLDFGSMTRLAGFSFMAFNLLCAPCAAAMGAIRREMGSAGWTAFALSYQCLFAYAVSLMIYQFGSLSGGNGNPVGFAAALMILAVFVFMLVKPANADNKRKPV